MVVHEGSIRSTVWTKSTRGLIPQFSKQPCRDMRSYAKVKGYRKSLAKGYATTDLPDFRNELSDYLNCEDQSTIELCGYSMYEWRRDSTFEVFVSVDGESVSTQSDFSYY